MINSKSSIYPKINYPFGNKENIIWVISSQDDLSRINQHSDKLKVISHFKSLENHISQRHSIMTYNEITRFKIPIVGLLSNDHEQSILKDLSRISLQSSQYFNVYDSYNESAVCVEKKDFLFNGLNVSLYPTVLLPIYYSFWAFVNFLCNEIFISKTSNTLEMFAGSGIIGFILKKNKKTENISYADINFWAIKSIRETISKHPELNGNTWVSECFGGIPLTEKYDVIIGNPPHVDKPLEIPDFLPGFDPDWEAHRLFFDQAADYLNPNGKIILIENKYSSVYEKIYENIEKTYKHFRIKRKVDLDNHLCYIIEIEKV